MTQSSPLESAPQIPHPTMDFDRAQSRLEGVLALLRLEGRIQDYRFREPYGEFANPPLALTVLAEGADFEVHMTLRQLIREAMQETEIYVDLSIEDEAQDFRG